MRQVVILPRVLVPSATTAMLLRPLCCVMDATLIHRSVMPVYETRRKSSSRGHVEAHVTWEDIEPEEGRYDFSGVDALIDQARERGGHLQLPFAPRNP